MGVNEILAVDMEGCNPCPNHEDQQPKGINEGSLQAYIGCVLA